MQVKVVVVASVALLDLLTNMRSVRKAARMHKDSPCLGDYLAAA